MKTTALALAAALGAGLAYPAFAGQPNTDWMPMEQALSKLTAAGYGNIDTLKAEDGHWEGRASKDGRIVDVNVDPKTGAISTETNETNED